jgi:hypothetical protein
MSERERKTSEQKIFDSLNPEEKAIFEESMNAHASALIAQAEKNQAVKDAKYGTDWHPRQLRYSPGDVFSPGTPALPEEEKEED